MHSSIRFTTPGPGAAIAQCLGIVCWNLALWAIARRRLGIDASVLGLPARKEGGDG